jgi:hypothetical protein
MKGFVYKGQMHTARLYELAERVLAEPSFYLTEDLDDYRPGIGVPSDLKRKGRLFSENAELRYERADDGFACFLLTENSSFSPQPPLTRLPGEWEVVGREQLLVDAHAPYVKPQFSTYPNSAKRVSVYVYSQQGISRFTRLRRFIA